MAIGKFVAGEAGLNPADYADMNAVAASATAMDAVAASAKALHAVLKSSIARNALISIGPDLHSWYSAFYTTLEYNPTLFKKITVGYSGNGTWVDTNPSNAMVLVYGMGTTESGEITEIYHGDQPKKLIARREANDSFAPASFVSLGGIKVINKGGCDVDQDGVRYYKYTALP